MTVGTLPRGFKSRNHWGLLFRSTLIFSYLTINNELFFLSFVVLGTYGICLASKTNAVL